ncbi:MAG TPA: hypothetical protein VLI65_11530 [Pyrinomonadaceae bacterium]|nr:hypothetical protein [Pyrinomonadaceae bacterium]
MYRHQAFDSFYLNNYRPLDHQVYPITAIKPHALVNNRQGFLSLKPNAGLGQLEG